MADPSKEHEDRLIAAAIADQPGAYDALVGPHLPALFGFCRQHAGEDAEDVFQEALLQAWRGLARFEGRSRFYTWLCQIAKNVAYKERDRRKRRPVASGACDDLPQGATREDIVSLPARLRDALGNLRPNYLAVWLLRELHGLSYPEIAEALEIKVDEVRRWLHHARVELRLLLGEI